MKHMLSVIVLMLWSAAAHADRYYCMVFSWDSKIPMPHKCHTWGTFAQVDDSGKLVREVTLSWTPEKWRMPDRASPGFHLGLKDTIEFARDRQFVVRVWGPYQIEKEFFQEGVKQYERKDMLYKFIDGRSRRATDGKTVNCIHCLSDTSGAKSHRTWCRWGKWASRSVVTHFDKNGLIKPVEEGERDKVFRVVGIDSYAMITRD